MKVEGELDRAASVLWQKFVDPQKRPLKATAQAMLLPGLAASRAPHPGQARLIEVRVGEPLQQELLLPVVEPRLVLRLRKHFAERSQIIVSARLLQQQQLQPPPLAPS